MTTLAIILADLIIMLCLLASLNLIVGKTGVWAIGHIAFYASGQLFLGIAVVLLKLPVLLGVGLSMTVSGLLSFLLAATTLRLKSDFFIIASIATATIVQGATVSILGPRGVSGIPRLFSKTAVGTSDWLYITCTLMPLLIIILMITRGLGNSPLGRVSAAVRASEEKSESLGISAFSLRLFILVAGSMIASLVGCLAATYYQMTDPAEVTLYRSILVFAVLLLGGVDSIKGTIIAGILLTIVPRLIEYLLGTPEASYYAGKLSQLLFGLVVLLLVRTMPRGIFGNRRWIE